MSIVFRTTALGDEIERFFAAALMGEMHVAKEEPAPLCIGSQQTPISSGLSEGYTHQDIAHFYIARALGNDWRLRIIENLNNDFLSKIEEALESFRSDAAIEIAHQRKQPVDVPF